MIAPLDFYFDFSSPYGYLASLEIDELAARHGRAARWRPILLGVVFKTTGQSPLLDQPLRGPYARRDLARTARELGVPFRLPDIFPINAMAASRAYYWFDSQDPAKARAFAQGVFAAIFVEGRDLGPPANVIALARDAGLAGPEIADALNDTAVKDRLRAEVDAAMARGVFGSPVIMVDDEPFWGFDHLPQVERWLTRGGW
ncbi:MAG: 2-hydroxychromene-2-carboxylate isomerase [Alphaproteobacteria bacterium]|nr:2-hydroxychromene-2-carboxylate isomerase [Alphaproteobacteria bacterium]